MHPKANDGVVNLLDLAGVSAESNVAFFGCIDKRIQAAHIQLMSERFGLSIGQYYYVTHPGGIIDFNLSACEDVAKREQDRREQDNDALAEAKNRMYSVLKLLFSDDVDVRKVILASHMDCAADKQRHQFASLNDDRVFQMRKLEKNIDFVRNVAHSFNHQVMVIPAVIVKDEKTGMFSYECEYVSPALMATADLNQAAAATIGIGH